MTELDNLFITNLCCVTDYYLKLNFWHVNTKRNTYACELFYLPKDSYSVNPALAFTELCYTTQLFLACRRPDTLIP